MARVRPPKAMISANTCDTGMLLPRMNCGSRSGSMIERTVP